MSCSGKLSERSSITSNFRDIFSVFQKPDLLATLREVLLAYATKIQPPVECVAGIDARGFLLGPLIALELKVPFVPIRKKGKLPGKVLSASYALEYGHVCTYISFVFVDIHF